MLKNIFDIFKVDGESKTFDKGFTNYESKPFGEVTTDAPDYTNLIATPDDETGETEPDNYIWIEFDGTTTGTFSPIFINLNLDGLSSSGSSGTLTVTKFEDVDGVIEGTFSGTVDSMEVTEGEFRVKRVAEGTFVGGGPAE